MKKFSLNALYASLFLLTIMSVGNFNSYAQEDFSTSDDFTEESSDNTEVTEEETSSESFDESDSY